MPFEVFFFLNSFLNYCKNSSCDSITKFWEIIPMSCGESLLFTVSVLSQLLEGHLVLRFLRFHILLHWLPTYYILTHSSVMSVYPCSLLVRCCSYHHHYSPLVVGRYKLVLQCWLILSHYSATVQCIMSLSWFLIKYAYLLTGSSVFGHERTAHPWSVVSMFGSIYFWPCCMLVS